MKRASRTEFRSFISAQPDTATRLPMTHLTDSISLRDMIKVGSISTADCPVFLRPLLYCFHARPAYRKNAKIEANSMLEYAPVVFLLHRNKIKFPAQLYPFDTGAFNAGVYKNFMHHSSMMADFSLEPSKDMPGKLIGLYFGGEIEYYDRNQKAGCVVPPGQMEAMAYYRLISSEGVEGWDDRVSSIEFAFDDNITINKDIVMAAFITNSLHDAPGVGSALTDNGIRVVPYSDGKGFSPASQIPRLYDFIRDFYLRESLL